MTVETLASALLAGITGGADRPESGIYRRAAYGPVTCSKVDPRNDKAWMCSPIGGGPEASVPKAYLTKQ
jgi:hypothetical protein